MGDAFWAFAKPRRGLRAQVLLAVGFVEGVSKNPHAMLQRQDVFQVQDRIVASWARL